GGAGQAQGHRGAPRVRDGDGATLVGEVDAGAGEPSGERVEVLAGGEGDGHVRQAQAGGARPRAAAVPGVHRDVVVVAAGGREQRAGVIADGHLEAEGVDVELPSGVDVAHLQVHVAHDAGVDAGIGGDGLGEVLGEVGVRVDVQRVHGHLAARPLPGLARPVPVQLDAVALGVGEV